MTSSSFTQKLRFLLIFVIISSLFTQKLRFSLMFQFEILVKILPTQKLRFLLIFVMMSSLFTQKLRFSLIFHFEILVKISPSQKLRFSLKLVFSGVAPKTKSEKREIELPPPVPEERGQKKRPPRPIPKRGNWPQEPFFLQLRFGDLPNPNFPLFVWALPHRF